MTPFEAAAAIGKLNLEKENEVPNGIRRTLSFWRNQALKGYRSSGIGRAIWGDNTLTSLRAIVKRMRVVRSGDGWTAGLEVRGIASLMETGGRTLPHDIRSHGGKLWRHPGSRVPQVTAAADSVAAAESQLAVEMDKALTKAIAKAGLYVD